MTLRLRNSFRFASILVLFVSLGVLPGCGDDDGITDPVTDQDISLFIEGEPLTFVGVSATFYDIDDDGIDIDVRSFGTTLQEDGTLEEDLEDGHDGVRVEILVDPDVSLLVQLLGNGQVLDETSSPFMSEGEFAVFRVEAGEIPDEPEF